VARGVGVAVAATAHGKVRRVAFLTPEFPTEKATGGGVGSYVWKMATALTAHGVEAEVFVPSLSSGVVDHHGIRVERVPRSRSIPARALVRSLGMMVGQRSDVVIELMNARRLAQALDRRHAERPFDLVQSSNHRLTGAFVRRAPGRRRVIRVSTSRRLYDDAYGIGHALMSRSIESLDVRALRRADLAYAPSRFLADYFNDRYGTDLKVLRPPAELGGAPAEVAPVGLPERYLLHFGALGLRKGTEAVARALPLAWRREPELRMVWAGPLAGDTWSRYQADWGEHRDQVTALGPLDKALLYRVVSDAVAAVLPSTVDNLPNTVIESLALGVPVIGSDGASIDELVENGSSGRLVPIGNDEALAAAMVEAWGGQAAWTGAGFRPPAVLREMEPSEAVRRFLDLAASIRVAAGGPHTAAEKAPL
jgi:glycosyltransferase involved in cell wall biosynthesis